MPEEKKDVKQKPSRSYNFELVINKLHYENDLRKVQIGNTLYGAYPVVIIDLSLDPSDIILNKIYGKEPMKLTIKLLGRGQENIPLETIEFELMSISGSDSMPQMSQLETKDGDSQPKQRVDVSFMTISRKSYKTMTVLVNELLENMTPKEAIEYIVKKYSTAELVYDSEGQNTEKIKQLLLQPTTLYNTINYIDTNYGLFSGASNLGGYCQYDNKLYVMNLTKKMTKDYEFIVYHLSTDSPSSKKIIENSNDGKTFYTYNQLSSKYDGNTKFAGVGRNVTYVIKPENSLFKNLKVDYVELAKEFGAVFKGKTIDVDPEATRTTYKTLSTGSGGESDVFLKARLAREIIGLATVSLDLEKNLPVLPLMKVGSIVKLDSKTVEYVDLTGKYILQSSQLIFTRNSNDWESTANILLMRTNKSI